MRCHTILAGAAILATIGCEQVTRGDLRDMEAADDVSRCAGQYRDLNVPDPEHEIWKMCLESVSTLKRRDPQKVAARVIRAEGNVFGE